MWDIAIFQQTRAQDLMRDAEHERLARTVPRQRLLLLLPRTGILRTLTIGQRTLRALRLAFAE